MCGHISITTSSIGKHINCKATSLFSFLFKDSNGEIKSVGEI